MPARSMGSPAKMPKKIVPMLAQLATEPPRGADWMYELKWDGVRAVCFFNDGQVRFDSRKSTAIERQYPELQAMAGLLKWRFEQVGIRVTGSARTGKMKNPKSE